MRITTVGDTEVLQKGDRLGLFCLAIYLNLCFYYVLLREYLGQPEKYLKKSRHDGYCQTYMGELRSLLQM